jgi:hypothetical protein
VDSRISKTKSGCKSNELGQVAKWLEVSGSEGSSACWVRTVPTLPQGVKTVLRKLG